MMKQTKTYKLFIQRHFGAPEIEGVNDFNRKISKENLKLAKQVAEKNSIPKKNILCINSGMVRSKQSIIGYKETSLNIERNEIAVYKKEWINDVGLGYGHKNDIMASIAFQFLKNKKSKLYTSTIENINRSYFPVIKDYINKKLTKKDIQYIIISGHGPSETGFLIELALSNIEKYKGILQEISKEGATPHGKISNWSFDISNNDLKLNFKNKKEWSIDKKIIFRLSEMFNLKSHKEMMKSSLIPYKITKVIK
jgi:hypothetical protein